MCLPVLMAVERPPGLADVSEVRHWSYPDYTRVVVELTGPSEPSVHRLGADHEANRPERIYLEIPGVWVGRKYEEPIPVGDGLLSGVRLGQNTLKKTRVVIDLERYDHHKLIVLSNPDRVVIDVFGTRDRGEGHPLNASNASDVLRLPVGLRTIRTVVIDPGHGGLDPGAIGVGGMREKDFTLKLARQVRMYLERQGFRVVLTRDGDRTLSLEERTAIGEGARGDVFVSLHANAARNRALEGIETYYLDGSYERHAGRVAARENGVKLMKGDALDRTLGRLRVGEASTHSAQLARSVHGELIRGVHAKYPSVRNLGVKKGPFYVLYLSNVPSILVEAGFVTNRGESKRLWNQAYLDLLARNIADGLIHYRDSLSAVAAGPGG